MAGLQAGAAARFVCLTVIGKLTRRRQESNTANTAGSEQPVADPGPPSPHVRLKT